MGQLLRKLVNWLTRYSESLATSWDSTKNIAINSARREGQSATQLVKEARIIEKYLEE